mmetsp:Transcript_48589/g.103362  ORF Transcript_48589/g.103362 Transcript_48589/m.103362 type:complete len:117 (+) Transcript_48589:616-966(+)
MTSPQDVASVNPIARQSTSTAPIPDQMPSKAPSSFGAGMNPISLVIRPRNTGRTAMPQTRSATRKRPMTSKRFELMIMAGTRIVAGQHGTGEDERRAFSHVETEEVRDEHRRDGSL